MPCLSRGLLLAALSRDGAGAGVLNEALLEKPGFTMLTKE